jgi:hypothetical protein
MVAAGILAGLSWIAVQIGRLLINLVRAVRGRLRPKPTPDEAVPDDGRLATGHKEGKTGDEATPQEFREGSVRMEDHPDYPKALQEIAEAGFEVRPSTEGSPHVAIVEVVAPDGKTVLRVEKYIAVVKGMRFLDLEHEIGHMRQFLERFGDNPPPTERIIERPDGSLKKAGNQAGVLTLWQNAIVEYHNRLVEWLRLFERNADPALLKEHADGVMDWRGKYHDKGLANGKSKSQAAWAKEHFPDIGELARRYDEAGGRAMESPRDPGTSRSGRPL